MQARLANISAREEPTHLARILSPIGSYPSKDVRFPDCAIVIAEDLCFSVRSRTSARWSDSEPHSEVHFLAVPEIRAYGALMMAHPTDGFVSLYPTPWSTMVVSDDPFSAEGAAYTELISRIAAVIVEDPHLPKGQASSDEALYLSPPVPPPLFGGPAYQLRADVVDYKLAARLHAAIRVDDHLAIRGITTWIKSEMLWKHKEFSEEALNTLYISLEASFQMVLRHLRNEGVKDPSVKDASALIKEVFSHLNPADFDETYFGWDYETRIMSFHPASRYGLYQNPPMRADDFYDLRSSLRDVYRFLLAGYVSPIPK